MAPPIPITFGAASVRGFGLFSAPSAVIDPYFEYVTMLLHGDGTNGAQNNTFLDSSTNNFSITRNGDTTQGTFSPFSRADGNWSNYFSSSAIYAASNAAFAVGTGDFTLEAWVYPNNWTGDGTNSFVYSTPASNGLMFGRNGANFVIRAYAIGDILQYGTLPTLNTWTHIVAVRSGTTISMYYNGTRVATTTSSQNFAQAAAYVGRDGPAGGAVYAGYVSNLRLVKGTAVYDPTQTTLTVPTTPLTAVANTSLLVCQNNRFKDNSTNNFSLSIEGSPSIQVFNPFNPTTAYLAATNGGSGYFDGSGDSLSIANNAAFNLDSGDATIEAWVYYTSQPGSTGQSIFDCMVDNVSGYNFYSYPYGAGGIAIAMQSFNGGYQQIYTTNNPIPVGVWAHVAFTRASGTNRFFVNGVQCTTNTGSFTSSLASGGNTIYVGARTTGSPFYGYISNLRVLKGTAQYTANFTPPTAPFTNIANTSVLLNFTNGGIFDNAAMNNLQTVGNAQISTSVSKFGTGSLAFDGTGDYLNSPNSDLVRFGTGNFTVEFWLNTTDTAFNIISLVTSSVGNWAAIVTGGLFYWQTNYATTNLFNTSATSIINGTWSHIAVVRNGTTTTVYFNGVSQTSATDSTDYSGTGALRIGSGANGDLNGYIDDLRITKGYARYTANFTPPTAPFPNL